MHLGFKNLLLYSTVCSNYLELLAFSSGKLLWQWLLWYFIHLPEVIKNDSAFFLVAVTACSQKILLVIQIVRMMYIETTENTSTGGIYVREYCIC